MVSKRWIHSNYWLSDENYRWLEREYGLFYADYFVLDRSWRLMPFYAKFGCGECWLWLYWLTSWLDLEGGEEGREDEYERDYCWSQAGLRKCIICWWRRDCVREG